MNTFGNEQQARTFGSFGYRAWVVCLALAVALSVTGGVAQAKPLAAPADFAVLAGTAVTCTDSTVTGDVGVYPGTAVTQVNCEITGTVHAGDGVAKQAFEDFLAEYERLEALECDEVLTGTLDGVTLAPGVYCFDAEAALTGVLTLNGPSDGIWIFKIGSLVGTGYLEVTNFSVVMAGGGEPCNVTWWVAQYAALTDSDFVGTILAGDYITITRGSFAGDAFAQAAVTMTGTDLVGCEGGGNGNAGEGCNQGVGNGPEDCDPGNSNQGDPSKSNDEEGGTPGDPGKKKGGNAE